MDTKAADKNAEFSEPLKAPEHSFDITAPSLNSSSFNIDIDSKPKYFEANIISRLLFSWIDAFIKRSKTEAFNQNQHYDLRDSDDCNVIGENMEKQWNHMKHRRSALFQANYRTFRTLVWASQILALIQTCFEFTGPLLVAKIISYIQSESADTSEGVLLIISFAVSRFGLIVVSTQNLLVTSILMNKVQKGTMGLIYRKFLRFPLIRSQKYSSGSIMNYMLVDVENLSKIFYFLPQLVQFPVMLFIGIYMIYTTVGLAVVGGVLAIVILGLLISLVGKNTHRCQKALLNAKDVRMKKTNEILVGIKYIKMWGAEEKFLESIIQDRELELFWVRKKHFFATLRIFLFWLSPILLSVCVFGCYTLLENELTPQKAFVVLSTLTIVQGPVFNIGNILNDFLQGQVSMKRVEKFMFAEEIDSNFINRTNDHSHPVSIKIAKGNFYWNHIDTEKKGQDNDHNKPENFALTDNSHYKQELILKDINIEIKKGAFVAILGDVGSGKSSLLQALLGEMLHDQKNPPSIDVNGSISYLAQKPWIVNATIKDNIVFDNYYDEDVYQNVLKTSCLLPDLKTFIKQDQTEIGEKGANLSGGQKARIALARAIYADSDIYLLDDPLSAVDAHVGKFILQECLTGTLKYKTRVLVTHKLESLRYVDYIYIMKGGQIVGEGDLATIRTSPHYQEMEQQASKEEEEEEEENNEKDIIEPIESRENIEAPTATKHHKHHNDKETHSTGRQEQIDESALCGKTEKNEILDQLMLSEDKQTGAVSWQAWKSFFHYYGTYKYFTLLISSIVMWITFKTAADFWLAHWSNTAQTDTEHGNGYYFGIYAVVGFVSVLFIFVRLGMVIIRGLQVSRRLHTEMFTRIIRAPLNLFFDRVPIGRLINKFSSDLDVVDGSLPFTLGGLLFHPVNLIARFVMCYVVGTGWVLPLICAFAWLGVKIQQKYLNIYREAYRLCRSTATPVTSLFAESLDGLTQIRTSEDQHKFLSKYGGRQNENIKNQILIVALKGWFYIRINLASLLIVVPTVSTAIMFSGHINDSPALIGLLITYLLDLSGTMITFLQQIGIFEAQLISFEKIVDVEKDPKTTVAVRNYSRSWPEHGEIELQNFYAKYRPGLPYVLRNTSFKINGGEKIGVVGRTGSGKSTILLSLLRIIEAQAGKIFIDGVDISQIGLDDLRRKITVIPQDPLLYKGSLRSNLDLLNQYSDAQIWTALEKVNMKKKFFYTGLDAEIKEGGGNLSAGEKQLLCIARAILNKNKIIFVDEATSSIDNVTEETILSSIRENFSDCTMITIAHRLKTIIGSDRILFMRDGQVLEFDTPKALLTNRNGHFYSLWREYEAAKA